MARLNRRGLPVTGLLSVVAVAYLLLWRSLVAVPWLPGPKGWPVLQGAAWPEAHFVLTTLFAAAIVAALLAAAAGFIGKKLLPLPEQQPDASVEAAPPRST